MTELYNLIFDFLFHSLLIIFYFITNFMTFINFSSFPLILILSYFVLHEEHHFGQEQEDRGTNYPHPLDPIRWKLEDLDTQGWDHHGFSTEKARELTAISTGRTSTHVWAFFGRLERIMS